MKNKYIIYVTEEDYYEVDASYFYIEKDFIIFVSTKEVVPDKTETEKVGIISKDKFIFIVNAEFDKSRQDD